MKSWKKSELKFIKENLQLSDKKLADMFEVSVSKIKNARKRHNILRPKSEWYFKKGHKPWNKGIHYEAGGRSKETQFKPGPRKNERKVGEIFWNMDNNAGKKYPFIKLEGCRAYPYQRFIYEQAHGIKLNKSQIVRFRDGNTANTSLSNLECVTRSKNLHLNENRKKQVETVKKRKLELLKALYDPYGLAV